MASLYDFAINYINYNKGDQPVILKEKVVLIVNVASECGYTEQYAGLEELYKKYNSKGFVIIGVPCNQFGGQEPGTEEEIKNFCTKQWNVTFPLTLKVDVNGNNEAPLYTWLKKSKRNNVRIKWNFEKFLIDREGKVKKHYDSTTEPETIAPDIEKLL